MSDTAAKNCNKCDLPFTLFKRRHHCRICGLIFCDNCSSKYVEGKLHGYSSMVRVCDECFEITRASERNNKYIGSRKKRSSLLQRSTILYSEDMIDDASSISSINSATEQQPAKKNINQATPKMTRNNHSSKINNDILFRQRFDQILQSLINDYMKSEEKIKSKWKNIIKNLHN